MQRLTAAGGPVRLGEYRANSVLRGQPVECRHGEVRRAGEAQPQRRVGAQGSKSRRRSAKVVACGSLLALFFQAAANQRALELGEIVDK
jgi:hypothetical protein